MRTENDPTRNHRHRVAFALAFVALAAFAGGCSCGVAPETPAPQEAADAGTTDTDDAGQPGADAGSPDAGATDAGVPPGLPAELTLRFRAEGHGETWALAAAELTGGGAQELVYAGRDLAAFTAEGLASGKSLWTLDWSGTGYATQFSDNEWAFDVKAVGDIDGDGTTDLIAGTSFLELYAVSGKTGAVLWRRTLVLTGGYVSELVLFDGDTDGIRDVFVTGGSTAYSGKTGAELWTAALPKTVVFAKAAELDGTPGDELLVAIENDRLIGGPVFPKQILHGLQQDGTLLFSFKDSYSAATALAVVDLERDGVHEAVVSENELVHVVGADGARRFTITLPIGPPRAPQVAAALLGDEPRLFVAFADFDRGPQVQSYGKDGVLRWEHGLDVDRLGEPQRMRIGTVAGAPALLLGTGQSSPPAGGLVALALEDGAPTRVLWEAELGLPVNDFLSADVDGQSSLWVGGRSARLSAVNPDDGKIRVASAMGSFLVHLAHGDLDGDGTDEACMVDETAHLRCVESDGSLLFGVALAVGDAGKGTRVRLADLDGDGKAEIVAGGLSYEETKQRGSVQLFDGSGAELRKLVIDIEPSDLAVADLDGDGRMELVVAEAPVSLAGGPPCAVRGFDATNGQQKFLREIGTCMGAFLAVGDADGEPGLEIAYADYGLAGNANVALLGADGAPRWKYAVPKEGYSAVAIADGRVLFAGVGEEAKGRLTARDAAAGGTIFSAEFAPRPDPQAPTHVIAGSAISLAAVPDLDGDGHDEWLVGLLTAEAALVSGADGAVKWKRLLEPPDLVDADRHTVAVVQHVPAHGEIGATFAVALGGSNRMRARVFTLSLDGEELSALPTQGEARTSSLGRGADGAPLLFLGAGLDVYGLGFQGKSE